MTDAQKQAIQQDAERDLAHEADMAALIRQQLRDNITPEEAEEELAEYEDRNDFIEGYDGDDQFCSCSVNHGIEELDSNQCDCCGKDIA